MKKLLLSTVAMIALAGSASAADIAARPYTKAPPMTPPQAIYNWTGFYIGGHVGGAFSGDNTLFGDNGRFMGGVQGGADYQFAQNWVVGIEAQYSWLTRNNSGTAFPGGVLVTDNERGLGSVTGRLGYTWGPALLYAKGGYAFRDNRLNVSVAGTPFAYTATGNRDSGYTVGAGLEYMFAPNWSAKAEYQYYNFGNTTFAAAPAALVGRRFHDDEHTVKVGPELSLWVGRSSGGALLRLLQSECGKAGESRPFSSLFQRDLNHRAVTDGQSTGRLCSEQEDAHRDRYAQQTQQLLDRGH